MPTVEGLPLLADERTTAFDAFLLELTRNKWLKGAGVTWQSWEDDPGGDQLPAADPILPVVIVTARPGPMGWSHAGATDPFHKSEIFVDLDCNLDGTDQRQGFKFWRAIERAIFPTDGSAAAVHARLAAAGISGVEITAAGFGIDQAAAESGNQAFRGTFKLITYIPTPVD